MLLSVEDAGLRSRCLGIDHATHAVAEPARSACRTSMKLRALQRPPSRLAVGCGNCGKGFRGELKTAAFVTRKVKRRPVSSGYIFRGCLSCSEHRPVVSLTRTAWIALEHGESRILLLSGQGPHPLHPPGAWWRQQSAGWSCAWEIAALRRWFICRWRG